MRVTITARRDAIPDMLKDRAVALLRRLGERAHRPTSAQLTFDAHGARISCEAVIKAARGAVHVASAEAADQRTALDRVAQKLRRQLDKAERPARAKRRTAAR